MRMRLASASVAEQNAAFNKVYPDLIKLAQYYSAQVNVPFVDVQSMVTQKMQTPEFRRQVVALIDEALDAAEAVRNPSG
jgi:hypothetical protein